MANNVHRRRSVIRRKATTSTPRGVHKETEVENTRPFHEELDLDQKRALIAMLGAIDANELEPSDEILFREKLDRGG